MKSERPRFRRSALCMVLVLGIGGCDAASLTAPAPAVSTDIPGPISLEINPLSFQFWEENGGRDQYVTFTDEQGNRFRYEASYDVQGRLSDLRSYYNAQLVGHDQPHWSGDQRNGHYLRTADGDWVRLDRDFEMEAFGDRFGGWEPCASGEDPEVIAQGHGCRTQFWNYGRQSAGMLVTLIGAGAASTASGGLAAVAAWGMVAYQTTYWYDSMRALDACTKERRGGGNPPIQIESESL